MCTITWRIVAEKETDNQPVEPRLYIVANRDESRTRVRALPPQYFEASDCRLLMPVDPQGQGSWIATNEFGLTVALLNNYEAEAEFHKLEGARSRGLLVKALAGCTNFLAAEKQLNAEDIKRYAPFHLLLFAGAQHPVCWTWNGHKLSQKHLTSGYLSTSAWQSKHIPKVRARYLKDALAKVTNESEHLHLLRSAKPKGGGFGVAMKRNDAMTVSTTTLQITPKQTVMHYFDGHPDEQLTYEQRGEVEYRLDIKDSLYINAQFHGNAPWQTRIQFEALFEEKAPALLASLPKGSLAVIKRVLREKPLNELFSRFDHAPPQAFCDAALNELGVELKVHSESWPSAEQRPIFVCNHPTGGVDGIVLMAALHKRYPELKVAANDVLKQITHLTPWITPVNVFGNKRAALQPLQEVFASGAPLMVFPSGKTARRDGKGQLDDGEWSGVPAKLALKHNRVVVPLHIKAHNSKWFDTLAAIRKRFGVNMNIEMLLLVRELMKPACKQFHLHCAKPLSQSDLSQIVASRIAGELLKQKSYALVGNTP
ncbi:MULTISPECIES: NRDE family protein [Gammaproteobacteria]|uniref:NRDE family protein n=1 Tax=Gammaproteobacteria TaxID=1236 RepID=UPI000DCFD324|nr:MULTISPECIES: NRDE family protein [Gammaproteobacteria]RTE85895.1 hypothetical protein DQX04_10645 [Aliidiomarina sp. B3213]TCZ90105.1 hypothetical protein EYQ95_09820 [Lysobacter sp. N42]